MASVFWNCDGVLLLNFIQHKTTLTGPTYGNKLRKFHNAIKEKRRGKLSDGILVLHDDAPIQMSTIATDTVCDLKFGELCHPPYSPDLAPSDYYLFSNLKKFLRGTRFLDDSEVESTVQRYFDS